MKVIGHQATGTDENVVILFDELSITYQSNNLKLSPMQALSQEPRFYEIARKHKLTCDGLRYGSKVVLDSTAVLYSTVDGNVNSKLVGLVYFVDARGRRIQVRKGHTEVAEEVFKLMTGQSLKYLWEAYCREKGIPLPKS